jgi:N-carbamoyl-L-amino-acid hydrolase
MAELKPIVHIDALMEELETLAHISEADPPVVTRIVFSHADLRARVHVKELCREAGLSVREDAIGNTFIRWEGLEPDLAPVATGSHIDAIPNAGAYDGVVGVLGGLEAIRALQRAGYRPRRPIELVIFTSEEPTRFGIGCLGSRMMGGVLTPEQARGLHDKHGHSLDELRAGAGFLGELESVQVAPGHFHAFVELHIEQGALLEREGLDIGVVTHIAAPASLKVDISGEGGHAGAILMPERHDALCAAAELILALEAAAKSTGAIDSVATVGICEVFPGAVNSVPSKVHLETDIRDTDAARRDAVIGQLKSAAEEVSVRRGVSIQLKTVNADPPAACDPAIVAAVDLAATASGLSSRHMVSRAYHDSLFVARFAPVAMIFIPCHDGISHRPDEYSSPEWIAGGVKVLAETLARLAE